MGKYPVINLSLKSAKQGSLDLAFQCIREEISNEFKRHKYIIESDVLKTEKEHFMKIVNNDKDMSLYITALKFLSDCLNKYHNEKVIILIDEYDVPLENAFFEGFYKEMIGFIRSLFESALKTNSSLEFSVITGCLRISKESIFTGLNNLKIISILDDRYAEHFGFTDDEVDYLYEKYSQSCENPHVSRKGLQEWYDGYFTVAGKRLYNPRSVVMALSFNQLSNYWTSSGPYDEIFYYIRNDIDQIRNDLALMIAGEGVTAKIDEFAASAMNLQTRNQIYSAMVVYGLLTFTDGKVYIPNRELMLKYEELLQNEKSLGYVYQLAHISEQMLNATLSGDTKKMAEILQYAHNTETPILSYNNEVELSAIVNLVYLSARDRYRVEREDKAGKGFVDFIFYPYKANGTCIILELKVGHSPEQAIQQIKDKQYILRFQGKLGETPKYTGKVLGVGISYDKDTKEHKCIIETLSK